MDLLINCIFNNDNIIIIIIIIIIIRRRRRRKRTRMDLKEIGINTRNWVHSAQDRGYLRALGNAGLNLRVP